jgi:hypothetical protein|nr:MAG TPA: hypothetical protein [Bacteriophage sp.]
MEQSTKETILANLSDASGLLIDLWNNLDSLIERCEIENRCPSIQELRYLREHIDDTSTYIARVQEQINEPTRTSKTWIS